MSASVPSGACAQTGGGAQVGVWRIVRAEGMPGYHSLTHLISVWERLHPGERCEPVCGEDIGFCLEPPNAMAAAPVCSCVSGEVVDVDGRDMA